MYLLVLYFPIMNALILFFLGSRLGKMGAASLSLLSSFLTVVAALWIFWKTFLSEIFVIISISPWINLGLMDVKIEFVYDNLSSIMLLVITIVSWAVQFFSVEYMYRDPHLIRFLAFLSSFAFFMIFLVTSDNYIQLFIGWEGVGIMSYLLINFWSTRIAANKAAMKAIIINKLGDISLLLAMVLLFCHVFSLDFFVINCLSWLFRSYIYLNTYVFWINIEYLSLILFLFILGACAKSAQIGLHTWLPDAMEGPTPVSALIHAATMVTAGVFLLLRSVHLFKYDENSLLLLSFLGGITSFIAATIGLFQNDIKKVIAYSTCSQLGYMVLSCGLNNYSGSLFHLMNHAFFKALLFLSAGAIIHSMLDQQDVRRMGMLLKYLPVSYIMILVGSLTIMGIPFLTGFYSKDFILEYVYSSNIYLSIFLYWLGIISASLTSFYSIKLLFLTFYNVHNSYFNILYNKNKRLIVIHESKFLILIALIILFLGSIFVGFLFKDLFIGMGTDVWTNTLDTESYKDNLKVFDVEFLPMRIKIIPIICTLISALLSFLFFKFYIFIVEFVYKLYYYFQSFFFLSLLKKKNITNNINMKKIVDIKRSEKKVNSIKFGTFIGILHFFKKLIYNGYYFNEIYNYFLYKNKKLSYNLFKDLDKGIIEFMGHLSIVSNIKNILYLFSKKNKSRIDYIVFIMILGIVIISIILLWNLLGNLKIFCILLLLIVLEIVNINKKNKNK